MDIKLILKEAFDAKLRELNEAPLNEDLLTEAAAIELLESEISVASAGDVNKYANACDIIIKHLTQVANKIVDRVTGEALKQNDIDLVNDILTKCSTAKVYIGNAIKAATKGSMEDSKRMIQKGYELLKKSNFKL